VDLVIQALQGGSDVNAVAKDGATALIRVSEKFFLVVSKMLSVDLVALCDAMWTKVGQESVDGLREDMVWCTGIVRRRRETTPKLPRFYLCIC
jgi:hypothetical protein